MKHLTGLRKTGRPGVYLEEAEEGGFVVLRNRIQTRHEGGATYAFAELAAFPTLEEARAYTDPDARRLLRGEKESNSP
jgi:hypothetical protein